MAEQAYVHDISMEEKFTDYSDMDIHLEYHKWDQVARWMMALDFEVQSINISDFVKKCYEDSTFEQ